MTCRHKDRINNPECSSYRTPDEQLANAKDAVESLKTKFKLVDTPDAANFEIEDLWELQGTKMTCVVLKVRYPSCAKCSFEGVKVMVFDVSTKDVVRWREIDPHFRETATGSPKHAPSPVARFPGDAWEHAKAYAYLRAQGKLP